MRLLQLEAGILKNKHVLLFGVYSLAHIWILLIPNALFWDDWVLHNTTPEELLALFDRAGSMFNIGGRGHVFMQGIWLGWYKLCVFFFFFGSGIVLDKILERSNVIPEGWRTAVVVLFLILPLNPARIAQINFYYAACYFSFFLAWLAMDRQKIAAIFLFFFSFNTNSILVFYAIPFVDYVYRNVVWKQEKIVDNCGRILLFALLPFLYFFVKVKFYPPTGEYATYNTNFSLANVGSSLKIQVKELLGYVPINSFVLISGVVLLAVALSVRLALINSKDRKLAAVAGCLGFVFFVFACFPYWVVGHIPTIHEWTSRHQLLMPLGVAFLVISICIALGNLTRRIFFYSIVIFSVAIWMNQYKNFYFDWKKQERLVQLFSSSEKLKGARLVAFQDETANWNAIGRVYRPYEWNGLMALSFGDESRFGVLDSDLSTYCAGGYDGYFVPHYKSKDHFRTPGCAPVVVRIFENKNDAFQISRRNVENISISILKSGLED